MPKRGSTSCDRHSHATSKPLLRRIARLYGRNEDWARRKGNVALRCHASSMLASEKLKAEGRSQWPDAALKVKEFALHGGGFPVRVRGVGVVAAIAISGLTSREDHDMIVTTLAAHLNVTDFATTP
jgi:uncharacterized protein (UPF0303 family)